MGGHASDDRIAIFLRASAELGSAWQAEIDAVAELFDFFQLISGSPSEFVT
ncbi:hypothetical protein C8R48DRAFT_782042 [Suillus tomentosus]|nr:hypothetical protein C8R48DRAFT_782042 [Suillus tomentosus]